MHVPLPEGELEAGNMYYKKQLKAYTVVSFRQNLKKAA